MHAHSIMTFCTAASLMCSCFSHVPALRECRAIFFNPPPPGGGWVPRRGKFFQCKMRRRRHFLKIPCFWDLFSWVGVSPAGPLPPGDGGQNPGGRLSLSVYRQFFRLCIKCITKKKSLCISVYHKKNFSVWACANRRTPPHHHW